MENEIVNKYTGLAEVYDSKWRKYLENTKKEAIQKFSIEEGDKVLDLGCGTGLMTGVASKKVGAKGEVIGLDITPAMLDKARKKYNRKKNVVFKEGDAHELPFRNYRFDHVVNASMLHYAEDPRKVLEEVNRVLKKDGKFLFIDWCADFFWMFLLKWFRPEHVRRVYSTGDVEKLFSDYFHVMDVKRSKVTPFWGVMIVECVKK